MAKKQKRAYYTVQKSRKRRLIPFFILFLALPVVVFLALQSTDFRQLAQSAEKPNIIVIMTDDQRFDEMETLPTVTGRMAARGVTFTNAFISTPLCCPSRASFFSGLYSHNTNVWSVLKSTGYDQFTDNDSQTIAVWLKNAGYKTALIGKYLNEYNTGRFIPPGWTTWYAFVGDITYYDYKISNNGRVQQFGTKQSDYSTDVLKEKVVSFIKSTNDPFFMVFAPKAPHGSGEEGDSGTDIKGIKPPPPAQRHMGTCAGFSEWQKSPAFNEADISDKPKWVSKLSKVSAKDAEASRKGQLCALKAVDEAIAAMYNALGARADNTVFIFYTDNGFSLGEHRYVTKNCFYEECAKTPLIISYPKMITSGVTSDSLVSNVDLTATIADLAGVTIPVPINGRSIVPLFSAPSSETREHVLIEVRNNTKGFQGSAIRTKEWKYIELTSGEKELYDMLHDPFELQNVVNVPSNAAIKQDLAEKLSQLREE